MTPFVANSDRRHRRADCFSYGAVDVDESAGLVLCHYQLDERKFVETVSVGPARRWTPAALEATRLLHLVAGVSYYKAGAARTIDLGATLIRPGEREFLRSFYLDGLGEFAFQNGLSLDDIELMGGQDVVDRIPLTLDAQRPLLPFGGGIDSIVTVDLASRTFSDIALFVASQSGDRFSAIEAAARMTGFPVLRAERSLDPQLLDPKDSSMFFNGHIPITGVLSALAVLIAVLDGRGMVVMSNEWSASRGNIAVNGRNVNHQYSKSDVFENAFRKVLDGAFTPVLEYFSILRPFSELWVAQHFARLERFHSVFHSCNRAFRLDATKRMDRWCGRCDKCCFIDLILSPFVDRARLSSIFNHREPLGDLGLLPQFRDLLGIGANGKPFECVGDVDECRTAATLAVERSDRADNEVLCTLVKELGPDSVVARSDVERLLQPLGSHNISNGFFAATELG